MGRIVCYQIREGDTVFSFHTVLEEHYITEDIDKVTCQTCVQLIEMCRKHFAQIPIKNLMDKMKEP